MPVILGANSASGGYNITNSLRFNSGSSDYLNKTPSSAGNRKTWTLSCWIKRSIISSSMPIFSAGTTNTSGNYGAIYFLSTDELRISDSSSAALDIKTSAKYRDVSAWYHIVIAIDTTQATSSNRVKFYVNGEQVTSLATSTYPSQNAEFSFNNNVAHNIGRDSLDGTPYFNGYMSEIYFIDGQALTPSSFGETDEDTGIWKPKAYTGSYGTNGFYLKFADSSALGTDSSGNGNTFTVNNLTSIDQTTDTPTNNFATMNPLDNANGSTFSEGNCKIVTTNGAESFNTGTIPMFSGKWYWEVKVTSSQNREFIGITDIVALNNSFYYSSVPNAVSYYASTGGYVFGGGSSNTYGNTYTTGDIIGVALDITNNKLYFSKNGTFQNSGDPVAGTNGISISSSPTNGYWLCQVGEIYTGSSTMELNFGNPPFTIASGNTDGAGFGNFEYAPPSGYYALNTKNLATFG